MRTSITFDREAWPELKHLLFGKQLLDCTYCGKRVNKKNIAGVEGSKGKMVVSCNSICCLIKASKVPKRFKKEAKP